MAGVANVVPLGLFFAGIAMVATGIRRGSGAATGIAAGTLVTMYVFDLVGKLADGLEPLRYLSVFRYHGTAIENGIDPVAFIGIALMAALLALGGTLLFERRDVLS